MAVLPVQMVETEKLLDAMEADIKAGTAAPRLAENLKMSRAFSTPGFAYARMASWVIGGSIYPTVVLDPAQSWGCRAACRAGGKPG